MRTQIIDIDAPDLDTRVWMLDSLSSPATPWALADRLELVEHDLLHVHKDKEITRARLIVLLDSSPAMSALPLLSPHCKAMVFLHCLERMDAEGDDAACARRIFNALLSAGFDIDAPFGKDGETPLMLAIDEGNEAAIEWLLPRARRSQRRGDDGANALFVACQRRPPDVSLIQRLLPGSDARELARQLVKACVPSVWSRPELDAAPNGVLFLERRAAPALFALRHCLDDPRTMAAAKVLLPASDLLFRDNGDTFLALVAAAVAKTDDRVFQHGRFQAALGLLRATILATRTQNPKEARSEAKRITQYAFLHLAGLQENRKLSEQNGKWTFRNRVYTHGFGLIHTLCALACEGFLTSRQEKSIGSWAKRFDVALPEDFVAREEARALRALVSQPVAAQSRSKIEPLGGARVSRRL